MLRKIKVSTDKQRDPDNYTGNKEYFKHMLSIYNRNLGRERIIKYVIGVISVILLSIITSLLPFVDSVTVPILVYIAVAMTILAPTILDDVMIRLALQSLEFKIIEFDIVHACLSDTVHCFRVARNSKQNRTLVRMLDDTDFRYVYNDLKCIGIVIGNKVQFGFASDELIFTEFLKDDDA